ncbi:hypothetical protein [Antarctic microvirus COCH21_V_SP_13]|nr:hypothetical protein [Antarctic microvirus COCH21_V_SP_13]
MRASPYNWGTAAIGIKNPSTEVNNLPSLTVPDMVPTMAEMIRKYVRSPTDATTFTPVYSDNPLLDNLERLDAVGKIELSNSLQEGISGLRNRIGKPRPGATPSPEHPDPGM